MGEISDLGRFPVACRTVTDLPLSPWQPAGARAVELAPGPHPLADRVEPFTRPGEALELATSVVCVATASGLSLGSSGGAAGAAGEIAATHLSRKGAVRGPDGSIATRIPYQPRVAFGVFTDRIGLYAIDAKRPAPAEVWSAPRAVLTSVERRPRRQLLARMRLHFDDDSSADFLLTSRSLIAQFAATIHRTRPAGG